jgi:hypothetical protein
VETQQVSGGTVLSTLAWDVADTARGQERVSDLRPT